MAYLLIRNSNLEIGSHFVLADFSETTEDKERERLFGIERRVVAGGFLPLSLIKSLGKDEDIARLIPEDLESLRNEDTEEGIQETANGAVYLMLSNLKERFSRKVIKPSIIDIFDNNEREELTRELKSYLSDAGMYGGDAISFVNQAFREYCS